MISENWVILGGIFSVIGTAIYISEIIKGKVKPNGVTWLLWSIAPLIAFAAQINQGVGILALTTFMMGFGPIIILVVSFFKHAIWKIELFDIICGCLSLLGLALWLITQVGNLAILFSIVADALAAVPTFRKSFVAPETEDYRTYLLGALSAAITLLAISNWTFAFYGFPLYILLINSVLVFIIRFMPKRLYNNA
jgi:hypothetical protein